MLVGQYIPVCFGGNDPSNDTQIEVQKLIIDLMNSNPYIKFFFEFFMEGLTVVHEYTTGNILTTENSSSITCFSTSGLQIGKQYVIEALGRSPIFVTVASIESATRFTVTNPIAVSLTGGTLKRTNWTKYVGYATASPGQVYYSLPLNIDAQVGGNKAFVIRVNTLNDSALSVYYKDTAATEWTEIPWVLKRPHTTGGGMDIEFSFPATGIFELKVIANQAVTIGYMIGMTQSLYADVVSVPPTFNAIPSQIIEVDASFSLSLSNYVVQTDGDPILSYSLQGTLPTGLSFNSSTGTITGIPTVLGASTVTVTATDKDGASSPITIYFSVEDSGGEVPVEADYNYGTISNPNLSATDVDFGTFTSPTSQGSIDFGSIN